MNLDSTEKSILIENIIQDLDRNEELKGVGYIFTLFFFLLVALFIKRKDKSMIYPGIIGYFIGIIIGNILNSPTLAILAGPLLGFVLLLFSALVRNIKNDSFKKAFEGNRSTRGSFWSGSSIWDKKNDKDSK